MMKSLRIFIVTVSGICLGYSLAYPAQDASLSEYNLLRDDGVDKTASSAVEDLPQHQLSRLGRLMSSYSNMLLVGQRSSLLSGITDKDRKPESLGFRKSELPEDTAVTINPFYMDSDFSHPDSLRGKRQQAWYVQYGKRSQGNFRQPGPSRIQTLKQTGLSLDNIIKALPLFKTVLNSEQNTPMIDYSTLLPEHDIEMNANYELDKDSSAIIEASDTSDDNLRVGKRDLSLHVIKTKRQQGWYTPYGKRNADSYQEFL
ncbi:unnamed protein product [Candidula unifasciata]|uniref:Uncharacterized protein n=1 Tax=Candidula unifasciata TaxID=100452 RepID=A0A8S3ZYC0_9EUPU|nr:unnamed protein product [Candidula unifasciata]